MEKLNILEQREIMGKAFTIYGTAEHPLFLAGEVAALIEHSNSRMMLQGVDATEKQCVNNPYALKGQQEQWFLTEDGLYEVLMQSRKPIAKQFKTKVKEILRTIRKTGTYTAKPETSPEPVFTPAVRTYRDRRVLTIKDIAQLIGKDEHALVYYLRRKSKCREGTDYHLLKGDELRQFKKDNNTSTYPSSLFVVLESGFRKLCKFFGIKLDVPTLFPPKDPVPVPTTVPVAMLETDGVYADPEGNPEIKGWTDDIRAHMDTLDLLLHRYSDRKLITTQEGLKLVLRDIGTELTCSIYRLTREKFSTVNA